MGAIQRAVRRACNPISTLLTMLVQGGDTGRALGGARGPGLPPGSAPYAPLFAPPRTGWAPRIVPGTGRAPMASGGRVGSGGDARQVVVPDVIGLSWAEAREVLHRVRLVAVGPDPDGPPLAALGSADGVVVDQRPGPGGVLPVGSPVTVWLERGPGSAGVREPRRPKPAPRAASAMLDEETNHAVG